jgi:hypothetical protein
MHSYAHLSLSLSLVQIWSPLAKESLEKIRDTERNRQTVVAERGGRKREGEMERKREDGAGKTS